MSTAQVGAAAEREARRRLEALGYFVVRGAGSKGNADLVAIAPGGRPVLMVQVKRGAGRLRPPEWNELFRLALEFGAVPVLAERVPRLPMRWFRLEGLKVVGGRPGPHQPLSVYDPEAAVAPDPGPPYYCPHEHAPVRLEWVTGRPPLDRLTDGSGWSCPAVAPDGAPCNYFRPSWMARPAQTVTAP